MYDRLINCECTAFCSTNLAKNTCPVKESHQEHVKGGAKGTKITTVAGGANGRGFRCNSCYLSENYAMHQKTAKELEMELRKISPETIGEYLEKNKDYVLISRRFGKEK